MQPRVSDGLAQRPEAGLWREEFGIGVVRMDLAQAGHGYFASVGPAEESLGWVIVGCHGCRDGGGETGVAFRMVVRLGWVGGRYRDWS